MFRLLAYTSIIAATFAAFLAMLTFTFLTADVNYILLTLIFFGTLTIYNIDHLRDLNFDVATNPLRVSFIRNNKKLIYLIIALSVIISSVSIYPERFKAVPVLIVPFILGLLHRKLKSNSLFASLYIALSWLIVTVLLPAYVINKTSHLFWISIIIGILLFCNAYMSNIEQKFAGTIRIKIIKLVSLIPLLIIIILKDRYLGLIPFSVFTIISLFKYNNNENYEPIYLDGLQLLGTVISIIVLNLYKFHV